MTIHDFILRNISLRFSSIKSQGIEDFFSLKYMHIALVFVTEFINYNLYEIKTLKRQYFDYDCVCLLKAVYFTVICVIL